ncbi:MAG: DNA mismatch repair protein MutS, partial [Opitutus sp.]|nr:DNA mismatch repair protein MutS [Opitutus sp.]
TTAAGARLLERWLAAPVLDLAEIRRRQTAVGEFVAQPSDLAEIRGLLNKVRDIPRILGRLQNRLRNPRELGGVRDTLAQLPAIMACLDLLDSHLVGSHDGHVSRIRQRITALPALRDLLGRGLADELPNDLADGNYIRAGYDAGLDRLRSLTSDNKGWLAELERKEQERTGIKSLKVRFTSVFGYYIEVTKANVHLVPSDYVRKQTTVNGERYVTEELKQKEKEIFSAEEKSLAREQELFTDLVGAVLEESASLTRTAEALAELDVLAGWAVLAREWDYCRPDLDEGDSLSITDGRHPVVEQMMKQERLGLAGSHTFVPNDAALSATDAQIILLTGPNMAGKSTYIRQVALIALMAQIGCWAPAKSCRLGLVDRIFSR